MISRDESNRMSAYLLKKRVVVIADRSTTDMSMDEIAKKYGVTRSVLRKFFEEREVNRSVVHVKLAAATDEKLSEDDQPPPNGDFRLPGYDAWQLVHHERLSVEEARKKLGLRYPSEVFELLAKHKAAIDLKRQKIAEAASGRVLISTAPRKRGRPPRTRKAA